MICSFARESVVRKASLAIARQASPMVISRWSAHSFARPCFNWPMSRLYASMTQVDMPGLALLVTQLTIAQSELLLAVPRTRLRPCPAMPVHPHDPTHFPGDPVRHQDLDRDRVVAVSPE